jgi:hypothetical protein
VITGGIRSLVHVIVLDVVALLPQPSMAVNILVLDEEQLDVDTAPSVNVIVVVLQPSLAVADPSAASISEAEGLQPRVVIVPVAVMTGGIRSLVQLTVLIAVARVTTTIRSNKCSYLREGTTIRSNSTISKCYNRSTACSSSGSRTKCCSDIGSRRVTSKGYRSRYNNNGWRTRCTEPANSS